jgi:VanZ family protein
MPDTRPEPPAPEALMPRERASGFLRAAGWACVVLLAYLSLIPADMEVRTGAPGVIEHAFAYACTGLILALGYPGRRVPIAATLVAYGSVLETLQSLVPGRVPHILDAAASGAGAAIGVALAALAAERFLR